MTKSEQSFSYNERVFPGLSYYFSSFIASLAVFLIVIPFGTLSATIAMSIALLLSITLSFLIAPVISVSGESLSVGRATIPLKYLKGTTAISKENAFAERGRDLDARAYIRFVIGVPTLAKVQISDSNDPTPYWLFSTRNPEILEKLLRQSS